MGRICPPLLRSYTGMEDKQYIKLLTLQVYMYFLICHSTQNSVFRNETRTILAEGGRDHVIATIT